MRKLAAVMLSGLMAFSLLTGCGSSSSEGAQSGSNESKEDVPVNVFENVKLLGRTYLSDDGKLWMGLSGTGADFDYTGDKLTLFIVGNAGGPKDRSRVGIYVDGERVKDFMAPSGGEMVDIEGKGSEPINVKVVKLSECAQSCCGISMMNLNGGTITPAAEKKHKIEIIGDSITCGYGVDDEDANHSFSSSTEDCTKSYSIKTAELLDADYSLVSFSGYGIISGYSGDGKKHADQLVPTYYSKYGFTYAAGFGSQKPQDIEWDFSKFVPEAIVINLGTNDASYTKSNAEKMDDYKTHYVEFLKDIRSKNADARIYCTLGIMDTTLCETVKAAAEAYTAETGDSNIRTFDFPIQNSAEDGIAADWHPSDKTHTKSAELLAEFIKTDMGW